MAHLNQPLIGRLKISLTPNDSAPMKSFLDVRSQSQTSTDRRRSQKLVLSPVTKTSSFSPLMVSPSTCSSSTPHLLVAASPRPRPRLDMSADVTARPPDAWIDR
ncbi:hypothetical protein EYF80_008731 [Liparis tanakae]|uniref:Uncharacterized protein n=1 Tax=Liparis tanakae TaxID=230148 RepID=A0A4Z2IT44_9TELE|nr:hypothetical protein EYF80_008731 [Liparis tanakae]